MKFGVREGSKARRIHFRCPQEENPNNGDGALGSNRNSLGSDSGSKDDAFFESRPCLDSDCEDDFFSVNGDFTPSRGSTPNHHFATPRRSQASKSSPLGFSPNSPPESSPNHQKQKLSELLQENQEGEEDATTKNTENGATKSGAEMENLNLNTNSGKIETKRKKEREFKSMQCCLPNLARSLSSKERRKPKTSPAH
uniref:Uncharacterized protein n=1 Tax=Ananas comosus var. bracteatus TaxID=296719 RepID=A0A6V7Q0Z1_ANACO|nr:unnamed protein product [Ananas comosus var. bracteatus]